MQMLSFVWQRHRVSGIGNTLIRKRVAEISLVLTIS